MFSIVWKKVVDLILGLDIVLLEACSKVVTVFLSLRNVVIVLLVGIIFLEQNLVVLGYSAVDRQGVLGNKPVQTVLFYHSQRDCHNYIEYKLRK